MTIAVDFDGVIHAYTKGWQDGTIYDPPLPGALDGLRALMADAAVFIHTTRDAQQVANWLIAFGFDAIADSPVTAREFWNDRGRLLVSSRKYPAVAYLDDRAVYFTNWDQALTDLLTRAPATTQADQLARIAQAHSKDAGTGGLTSGDCNECGHSWPCPTSTWATTSRSPLATWDPADDEPCHEHPGAVVIAGMCGGCTIRPADFPTPTTTTKEN